MLFFVACLAIEVYIYCQSNVNATTYLSFLESIYKRTKVAYA